jgi:hypothetical protein
VALFDGLLLSTTDVPMTVVYAERSLSEEILFLPEMTSISKNFTSPDTMTSCTPVSDTLSPLPDDPSNDLDSYTTTHGPVAAPPDVAALRAPLAPPTVAAYSNSSTLSPRPNQPIIQVTIRGMPSNSDLLSFSFLKPFGAVIEGRMISDMLNLYSPDGSSRMTPVFTGVVVFVIAAHSINCADNLLALSGTVVNCPTFLFSVSPSSPPPPPPPSLSLLTRHQMSVVRL